MLRGNWFNSLGHMIQFGTIKFCRAFKNYFGQFGRIEKSHYNSRVSLHEAPTKNTSTSKCEVTLFEISQSHKEEEESLFI